ncbi:MAG: peptide ABC transporter substrate-binding protein [Treponema sp.]|nr:peptide ABC transporter substrate-binding protein [Treponema sp.]
MKLKRTLSLIAVFMSLCTGFMSAGQKEFVIIEAKTRHQLNPQITESASDTQILTGLYEGLFSYNPVSLAPQYAIAVDIKVSRDKKRWTLKLNPEARFSNNEKITAASVRDSFITLLSNPDAPYASLLDVIKNANEFRNKKCSESDVGIYALSDTELMFHLKSQANYLPKLLCHPAFSVVHKNPKVYSGPFILKSNKNNEIILTKNQCYWDKNNVQMETIRIIQSDDAQQNVWNFNTGSVDWVANAIDATKLLNKKALCINAMFATSYFFFKDSKYKPSYKNSKEQCVWDYIEFREALFEAMPWNVLRAESFFPATTFVYPLTDYPGVEGFDYTDQIRAKELIKEARKKYNIPEDKILPLVFQIPANSFNISILAEIAKAFEELGIDLQVYETPSELYYSNVRTSNADVYFYSWIGDFADPLAFLELFRSDSSLNDSGFSNKEYDELLEKANETAEENRYDFLSKAETVLLDNYVVIPVQYSVAGNLIDLEETGGWAANAFDIHPLKYIYRKEPKINIPNVVKYSCE